jgi:hypothetical protein
VAIIKVRNFLFNFVSGYNNQRGPPPMGMGMQGQQPRGAYVQSQSQTTSSYTPKVTQSAPIASNATPFVATTNTPFPAAASQTTTNAAPFFVESPVLNLTASVFKPSSATTTFTPSTNQFPVA